MILGILISIIGTAFCTSHLIIWSFLVLRTLSTCGWLKTKVPRDALVLYFVVSVLGGLLFLISSCEFCFSCVLLQLALLLKLGFFPFQFWALKVLLPLDLVSTCFFLGPLKLGLLFLFLDISRPSTILLFLSLLTGLILLFLASHVSVLLYGSGSVQLLILVLLGPSLGPYYFLIYLFALLGIVFFAWSLISQFFAFFALAGLPPLTIFWSKALAILFLPTLYSLLVLGISVLSLLPYLGHCLALRSSHSSSLLICGLVSFTPAILLCFLL